MADKTTKKKTKKKTKVEKVMNEVEQEAKEYVESKKVDLDSEFPPITLPCRGYFKELDHDLSVKNLQIAMNHIVEANIPVTGYYDKATMYAVEKFEKQFGGCVNGKFGDTELKAYNKLRGVK